MELEWMAWTLPTAVFFGSIASILVGMTIWHAVAPAVERHGLLPVPTSRGDRLFIALLGSAYIHLAWIGLTDLALWWALAISVFYGVVLLRWG